MKIRAYGLFLCLLAALALISGNALGEAPGTVVIPEADPAERASRTGWLGGTADPAVDAWHHRGAFYCQLAGCRP